MLKQKAATIVLTLVSVYGSALADTQRDFSAIFGVGHSDNVRKESTDQHSETIETAGIDFSVIQDTRRLSLNSAADLEYRDYQTNAYDGVVGNLNASATAKLVPDRFEWLLQDNFGQVLSNPFAPATPDNRQNINYFTTGPDFMLGLGGSNKATLAGRYSQVKYASNNLGNANNIYQDNDRYSAALALTHSLSAVSEISLGLQSEKVNFSNDLPVADYDQNQAFLHYALKGSRTKIETDAGYAELSGSSIDDSGYLARLAIERKSTPFSTVILRFGHEFSDAGSSFRLQQQLQPMGLQAQSTIQTSNPFVSEYANVGWQLNRVRTSVDLGISYFDDSYQKQSAQDQTRLQASLKIGRLVMPNLRLMLAGNYSSTDLKQSATGSYHEMDSSLALSWQFSQHLSFDLEYDHYDRTGGLQSDGFEENSGWLRLRYGRARQ